MINEIHSFGEVVEKIVIERNKKVNGLIFGEIQKIAKENGIDTKIVINEKAVISALERRIPQKPVTPWDSLTKTPECPYCYHGLLEGQKYCDECGQALDWSDTE